MRQTVLRLMGLCKAATARRVKSANDCRLNGCWVSKMISQASACTVAWSRGGKIGLAPASWFIFQREVAQRPAASPAPHRIDGQLSLGGSLRVRNLRVAL